MPFDTSPTEFLSVTEQTALIASAQDVPVVTETDADGEEVTRYGKTPEAEAALTTLVLAFMPLISKAARASKVVGYEEAEAVALAEFVEAVRDYDTADEIPFSATIGTRLSYAVKKADRGNDVIRVKNTVAAAYWALMHKHGLDFGKAYEDVKAGGNGLAPETFLAVHLIMLGVGSLDSVVTAEDTDGAPRHAAAASVPSHEEAIARADEAARLLAKVDDVQRRICRLAYGFDDVPAEVLEEAASEVSRSREEGVAVVKDGALARHLGLSRPKVQRERTKALGIMRADIEGRVS